MRRLPIFFVLDVSESMVGENLRNLQDGLTEIVKALRTDAHALESVHMSIIGFAGITKTIVPLVELESFYTPKLPIGGGTSLGAALNHLMDEIDRQVKKTTADVKGDWKPIVYLMTDGKPTDNVAPAVKRWKENYAKKATMIAISIGEYADLSTLQLLTENVLVFSQKQEGDFTKFVKWVTASIAAQSQAIDTPTSISPTGVTLAKLDSTVLEFANSKSAQGLVDDDAVILVGRCQRKKAPYLMRFDRFKVPISDMRLQPKQSAYVISGCYPTDEEYFEWSGESSAAPANISTDALMGGAGCPHCANPVAFGFCMCGHLMCLSGPGEAKCPWCNEVSSYGAIEEGDPALNVTRGRG